MLLNEFGELLDTLDGIDAFRYEADGQDYPYMVYTEYGQSGLRAENTTVASYDMVQLDYYTQTKDDANVGRIRKLLNGNGIIFDYKFIFQRDNKVMHHIFDCSLL